MDVISNPVSAANCANRAFHAHTRFPLDPPQSAVISNRRAGEHLDRPTLYHQDRIALTRTCFTPAATVVRDAPDARTTTAIPPRPIASASAPSNNRH